MDYIKTKDYQKSRFVYTNHQLFGCLFIVSFKILKSPISLMYVLVAMTGAELYSMQADNIPDIPAGIFADIVYSVLEVSSRSSS